ncbi:putative potassium channel [Streptococcus sp. DD11]|uniref:potassium channel family protein n=1 Tax=Streptococcus sp. DD11 TaxID=1777879 RepID=UPI000798FD23|nr:potassium channel family protein [Streptococcus sp. DD11]KXT83557.1 putative potassium channel [Streptococcus sp. DD11]
MLALLSISLVILDFIGLLDIYAVPYVWIDEGITLIFAVDYTVGIYKAKRKWVYFKKHFFDLLAIIPFNLLFAFFRLGRIVRLVKLTKIFRLIGLSSKLRKVVKKFTGKNGIMRFLSINAGIIIISSAIVAYVEHHAFIDAVWWSVATVTTVGYGDIVPKTLIGKAVAVVLMFSGIGTLGLLTTSLTNFFISRENNTGNKLAKIETELAQQRVILEEIRSLLKRQSDDDQT